MSNDKKSNDVNSNSNDKKAYYFGQITKFDLEEIEAEVLNDSVYLDVFAGSDVAFKQDIEPVDAMLEKVMKLKPVSYHYNTDKFPEKKFSNKHQIGLLANDVEEVFPHLIAEDKENHKYLNYSMLTPVLLKSVQELTERIARQDQVISKLQEELKSLKK